MRPQSGLARLISRISLRISSGTRGLPPRRLDFQRQNERNPARCQRITVSGRMMASASVSGGLFGPFCRRVWDFVTSQESANVHASANAGTKSRYKMYSEVGDGHASRLRVRQGAMP